MSIPDREARRLARRIVQMQEGHDALVRATQLAWSTVPVEVDGESVEVPVPLLLEQGAQAAAELPVVRDEAAEAADRARAAEVEADAAKAAANAAQTAAEIAQGGVTELVTITVPSLEDDLTVEASARAQQAAELAAQVGTVDQRVTAVQQQVTPIQTVLRVEPSRVTISQPGSSAVLALDNDSITMVQDGQAVAWWEGGVMHAIRFEGDVVALGTHQFSREGNSTIVRAL